MFDKYPKQKNKNVVLIELIGGMGNQMFQFSSALGLLNENKQSLFIDNTILKNKNSYRRYELDLFNLKTRLCCDIPWQVKVYRKIGYRGYLRTTIRKIIEKIPGFNFNMLIDAEDGFSPEFQKLKTNVIMRGYWQSFKYFSDKSDTIRTIFDFNKCVLSSYCVELLKRINNTCSVAVHIRRGDYNLYSNIYPIYGKEYYIKAARIVEGQYKNVNYFLFGEDTNWIRNNLNNISNSCIITNDYIHQNWEELYLMSRCKHIITANSSFSWWSAWLGEQSPNRLIITPSLWKYNSSNKFHNDLLPKNWIKI